MEIINQRSLSSKSSGNHTLKTNNNARNFSYNAEEKIIKSNISPQLREISFKGSFGSVKEFFSEFFGALIGKNPEPTAISDNIKTSIQKTEQPAVTAKSRYYEQYPIEEESKYFDLGEHSNIRGNVKTQSKVVSQGNEVISGIQGRIMNLLLETNPKTVLSGFKDIIQKLDGDNHDDAECLKVCAKNLMIRSSLSNLKPRHYELRKDFRNLANEAAKKAHVTIEDIFNGKANIPK